jgi:hypothetical protein
MSLTTTTTGAGLVPQSMDQAVRLAEMMAQGKLVPNHLQKSPGDCLMVIEQAMRWGMSPFAVAQSTSVIQGKLMFEGKLVAAALHSSGALATRLRYDYSGEGAARVVRVSATLAGETEPRHVDVRLADAKTSNQLWTKQPDQQLAYHGARVWARRYAPEVMLGVNAPEEMEPAPATHPGPTIEARAEPPAEPTPADKARVWADDMIAKLDAARVWEDVQALVGSPALAKGLEKLHGLDKAAAERLEAARQAAMDRAVADQPPSPATTDVYDLENAQ